MASKAIWEGGSWELFGQDDESGHKGIAWLKKNIPYTPPGSTQSPNSLQTLDIWIPRVDASPDESKVPTESGVHSNGLPWIVYIHGGAWRDPEITSTSFTSTVQSLLSTQSTRARIGGLVSLNYSLSPYPNHPSNPSPPNNPSEEPDSSRLVHHPQHIIDVITALIFLQRAGALTHSYTLVGHSAGATLAFQSIMRGAEWFQREEYLSSLLPPRCILGVNGLYDLPTLIDDPGPKHRPLIPIYDEILVGAFCADPRQKASCVKVLTSASPALGAAVQHCREFILAQSLEDTLVPYSQTETMLRHLGSLKETDPKVVVRQVDISGDHDDLWQQGHRLAEILRDVLDLQ